MQANPDSVHLLLKDKEAEKSTSLLGVTIPRQIHTSTCRVLRGELVVPIPPAERVSCSDGQKAHNYHTISRESPATFYDDGTDVAPLNQYEYGVLVAIKSPGARYNVFLKGEKLDWGTKLKKGDKVSVELPEAASSGGATEVSAVVRYVGEVKTLPGITFGVEIKDKAYLGWGSSDGTFQNERYFQCQVDCGMFVSLDKLSKYPPVHTLSEPPPSGSRYVPPSYPPPTYPRSGRKNPVESSTDPEHLTEHRHKIGDRVVVFNKKGIAVHGVVKWVGTHSHMVKKKQVSHKAVGIETDVAVRSSEMEGLPSKGHLFVPSKDKSAVFFFEDEVMFETDFANKSPERPPVPERPLHSQGQRLHHEAVYDEAGPPQQTPYQEGGEESSLQLAIAVGMRQTEFKQQRKAMQEMERKRELDEVKRAIPDQSINESSQAEIWRQASEEQSQEAKHGRERARDQHKPQKEEPIYDVPDDKIPPQEGSPSQRHLRHQQQLPARPQFDQQHPGHYQQPLGGPGWHPPNGHHHHPQLDGEQQHRGLNQHPQPHPRPQPQPYPQPHPPSQPPHSQPPHPHPPQPQPRHNMAYDGQQTPVPSLGLEVGSVVQVANNDSRTGVIRWIGNFPGMQGTIAGVELDEPMEGCGDGEWRGYRCFTCPPGRGFFCPLVNLRPDTRIMSQYPGGLGAAGGSHGNPLQISTWEALDQTVPNDQIGKYLGEGRGIQGHQNSCYLDATIFGLFALSDVFDSLFLDSGFLQDEDTAALTPAQQVQRDIGNMLWRGIVNPLRKNGAVRYESVMKLRNRLDDLGKMEGVNTAEKDPEEFLNMLFKHTLCVEPFIKIKRPYGTEPEFFVQLFVEFDESLKVPTIQALLEKMFKEQQISFDGVPSKLLVQVPRYGKQFQTYKRIIPGVKLDPSPLIDCPYTCYICQEKAWNICDDCKSEFATYRSSDGRVYFCNDCNDKVHRHKLRTSHKPEKCMKLEEVLELELLSVLCIETSHYVCFTRDSEGRWLFFDSMANRVHDQYNIPRGVDCTDQLNDWVYKGSPERLMAVGSRELPELVRRFTQDVYMCVYIQPDYGMYG